MLLALILLEERTYADWTSHGLNPNRPGFKPQVVILSGTVYSTIKNGNQTESENAYFQIRMRREDYYYCRKWNNPEWKVGSWYEMNLAIPGCAWHWRIRYKSFEIGGGGGSWLGRPEDLIPARRLWNGTNFVGANINELTAEERGWAKEEFQKLEKVGPYLVPRRIKFSGSDGDEIYTIKKVEFWNEPSTNWFWDVKRKYVDSGTMTNDLDEPGPFTGRR